MLKNHKPLPVLLAALLISLAFYVTILAIADILDRQAETTISNWFESSVNPSTKEWKKTLDTLDLAQRLDPMNSETLEKRGKLYQFSYMTVPHQSKEFIELNDQALALFRLAAVKRPTWAPHWGNIIQTKHDSWRYDEELERAIINAAYTAPLFENIQPVVLYAGARGWPELNESARQAVIKVLRSAFLVQPRETFSIVKDSDLLEHVLPMIEGNQAFRNRYQQIQSERKKKAEQQLKRIGR